MNLIIFGCKEWAVSREGKGSNLQAGAHHPSGTSIKLPLSTVACVLPWSGFFINTKISSLSGVSRSRRLKEELLITTPELSRTLSGQRVILGGSSFFLWLREKRLGLTQMLAYEGSSTPQNSSRLQPLSLAIQH